MKKYKIYLTKSYEVAGMIVKAHKLGEDGVNSKGFGSAECHSELIPAIYMNKGYYTAVIAYNEDAPVKPYELIIA